MAKGMKRYLAIITMFPSLALAEPAVEASTPDAAPAKAAPAEVAMIQPSRLIAGSPVEQVELLRARIAINTKERGPFGLNQDPGKQGSVFKLPPRRQAKRIKTPFVDVVKAVPVAAVFPSEQEFLVGSRTIRAGDEFPLVVRDEKITVRVESVRSRGVVFKNLKTGALATKRLDMLPDGITPGGKIQAIDGVVPAGGASSEPLHVDLSNLSMPNPTRSP